MTEARTVICDYCQRPAPLVTGCAIYPHRPDLFARRFYQCVPCDAYVGTHRDSKDAMPLGRLANSTLRAAKKRAHAAFDPLWQSARMKRKDAYGALARELGIAFRDCHIGMFNESQCAAVVEAVERIRSATTARPVAAINP